MVKTDIIRVNTKHYQVYQEDYLIGDLIRLHIDLDFDFRINRKAVLKHNLYINQETIKHLSTFINFKESLAGQETDKVLNKSLENNPSGSGKDE